MKYSAILAVAAAGFVAAQTIEDIPSCARQCILDATSATTTCSQSDYKCQCEASNQQKIIGGATVCVIGACGQDVALNQVLPAAQKFCEAVLTGGGTTAGTTTSAGTTTAPTTTEGTTTAPTTTEDNTSKSTTAGPTTTTSGTGTGTGTGKPSSSSTKSSTSTVATAAGAVASGVGSLAMLALGALAAF